MSTTIPLSLREPIYKQFAKTYNANLDEINQDLNSYRNFKEFFTRELKLGA